MLFSVQQIRNCVIWTSVRAPTEQTRVLNIRTIFAAQEVNRQLQTETFQVRFRGCNSFSSKVALSSTSRGLYYKTLDIRNKGRN